MNAARQNHTPDPFTGYFASVAVALIASVWLAGVLVEQVSNLLSAPLGGDWRINIGAGLFLGTAFANPVGAALAKAHLRRALSRFAIGFAAGFALQMAIFTPYAGAGMSNYLFLLLAVLAVPTAIMAEKARRFFQARDIRIGDRLVGAAWRLVTLPERVLFIALMMASFALFWRFAATPTQGALALAAVLALVTGTIALRANPDDFGEDPEEAEYRAWLDLEPEDVIDQSPARRLFERLKSLLGGVLPGAVLFGGMTRLAVEYLVVLYPNLHASLAGPEASVQTVAVVAATGLAAVFFGMMAALAAALTVMQLIGRARQWSPAHLRENSVRLIRVMYFRPMKRG
jgi:hypothetical protein